MRRLLIAALIAATGTLFWASPAAHAQAGIPADCGYTVHCIVDFYYNAAKTEGAGVLSLPCSGAIFSTGDTDTPYYTVHEPNTCTGSKSPGL